MTERESQTHEALCLLDKIVYGHANSLPQSAARLIVAELDRRLSAMRASSSAGARTEHAKLAEALTTFPHECCGTSRDRLADDCPVCQAAEFLSSSGDEPPEEPKDAATWAGQQYTKIQDFAIKHYLWRGQPGNKSHADMVLELATRALSSEPSVEQNPREAATAHHSVYQDEGRPSVANMAAPFPVPHGARVKHSADTICMVCGQHTGHDNHVFTPEQAMSSGEPSALPEDYDLVVSTLEVIATDPATTDGGNYRFIHTRTIQRALAVLKALKSPGEPGGDVLWARERDGSWHACAKGDPGAVMFRATQHGE